MTSAFRRTFRTGLAGTSGPLIVPVSVAPLVSGSCMATSGGVFRPFIVVFVALSLSLYFPLKCVNSGVSEVLKWWESGGVSLVGDRVIQKGDTWRISRVGRKMPVIELNLVLLNPYSYGRVEFGVLFPLLLLLCSRTRTCTYIFPKSYLQDKTPTITNKQISLVIW